MNNMRNFDRILNLVKKTGDKVAVLGDFGEPDILVLPLAEYEKLIEHGEDVRHLTEDELLDRINRDIALWKSYQESEFGADWDEGPDFFGPHNLYQDEEREEKIKEEMAEEEKEEEDEADDWWRVKDKEEDFSLWPESDGQEKKSNEEKWSETRENKNETGFDKTKTRKRNRFAIPEERLGGQKETGEPAMSYENIPPPPPLNDGYKDLLEEKKDPVIDMSFEDEEYFEENLGQPKEEEDLEDEQPVF